MAMIIDRSNQFSILPSFADSRRRMQALNGAAAEYLGMSRRELRSELETGKSLAELTKEKGKSLDGLRQAMRAADPGVPGNGGINAMGLVDRIIHLHQGRGHSEPRPRGPMGPEPRPAEPAPVRPEPRPRGPLFPGGPSVDPVPPKQGEDAYHTLPIEMPKGSGGPYHTLPIEMPKGSGGPYHTLPIEMPKGSGGPYHTLPIEMPKSSESPYHTLPVGMPRGIKGVL